jgi:hypothetical protein
MVVPYRVFSSQMPGHNPVLICPTFVALALMTWVKAKIMPERGNDEILQMRRKTR